MKGYHIKDEKRKKIIFNVVIFLIYFGVFTFAYRNYIFQNNMLVAGDGTGYFAQKCFWSNSIKSGEFALWNPYIGIGTPYAADVQNAVYDPSNLLYLFLNPVLAFNLAYILKLSFASFFMYMLIKEITNKEYAAVLIGVVYGFSGMLGGARINHVTITTTIVFFPLIIYYMEKYRKSLNLGYLLLSSAAMAFQFVVGFTQIVLYFNIILFALYVYICISNKVSWKKSILRCAAWVGAYLLISAVQLFPLIRLMAGSGINDRPWAAFTVLAYDLRILAYLFFPYLFKNIYQPWGAYSSTGIDIEIYIGIASLVYIIYLLKYFLRKDRTVQIYFGLGAGALVYGMLPKIPVLNQILYKIPILNSFRVAGRSALIFVFINVLLLGIAFAKISENGKEEIAKVIKINVKMLIYGGILYFFLWAYLSQESITGILDKDFYTYMLIAFAFLGLNLICLCGMYAIKNNGLKNAILLGAAAIFIVADIGRYSIADLVFPGDQYTEPMAEPAVLAAAEDDTENNYRSFALLNSAQSDKRTDIYSFGKAAIFNQLIYNNYITFIDTKLAYWGIPETVVYPLTTQMLNTRNDLISMLSIHSLVDPGDMETNLEGVKQYSEMEEVFEVKNQILNESEEVDAVGYQIDGLRENATYKITAELEAEEAPTLFYVDFYGADYDDVMQNGNFQEFNTNGKEISTMISTEQLPEEDLYFRVVWQGGTDIKMNSLKIERVEELPVYKQLSEENGVKVYENVNANKILYAPSKIYNIDEYGETYQNIDMQSVDRNNYIAGYGKTIDLSAAVTEISDIKVRNNCVTASVTADQDTFVNHSQLYTSGWKAYVDGKKVKVYNVNNLIQGIEVPEGKHIIEFRYEPWDVYAGLAVSVISLCAIALFIIRTRKGSDREVAKDECTNG